MVCRMFRGSFGKLLRIFWRLVMICLNCLLYRLLQVSLIFAGFDKLHSQQLDVYYMILLETWDVHLSTQLPISRGMFGHLVVGPFCRWSSLYLREPIFLSFWGGGRGGMIFCTLPGRFWVAFKSMFCQKYAGQTAAITLPLRGVQLVGARQGWKIQDDIPKKAQ